MSVLLYEVEDIVPAPDPEEDRAAQLLALINRDRAALGRQELLPDDQLAFVASHRAAVVASTGHYAHESPTGETAASILAAFGGPNCCHVGESLWSCAPWLGCSAGDAHAVFTASEPHRLNQLRPEYTHFGAGFAVGSDGETFVIELFSMHAPGEGIR